MNRGATDARHGERGRGWIGFFVALAIVILIGVSARAYYVVKHRADLITRYTYEVLENADRKKMNADDVQAEIYKKARELGVDIRKAEQILVENDNKGWRVRFEFSDTIYLPGYSIPTHTRVEKTWTRF